MSLIDAVVVTEPIHRRDLALIELLYATGARISEAVGLSIGEIDLDARLVRLYGKGSKERIVPFGSTAAAALDDWFSPSGRAAIVPDQWRSRGDAEAVFLNARGGRLSRQAAWAVIKRYGTRAGSAGSCRRTYCAIPAPPICSITAPTCEWSRRCSATRRSRRRRSTPRSARSVCGTSTARRTPGHTGAMSERRSGHQAVAPGRTIRHVVAPDTADRRRRGVGRRAPAGRRTRAVGTAVESGSAPQRRRRSSVRRVPTRCDRGRDRRCDPARRRQDRMRAGDVRAGRRDASSDHGPGRSAPITTTRTSVRRWRSESAPIRPPSS